MNSKLRSSPSFTHLKYFFWKPEKIIAAVICILLILGFVLARDYGETSDEPFRITYAQRSLAAYQTGYAVDLLDEKGAFYGDAALLGANLLAGVLQGWAFIERWHLMTYLSYLIGAYFFYRFLKRLVSPWPALAGTLLFISQPLIWGHAFINPKDMPFMAFFLASLTLGMEMVDSRKPTGTRTVPPIAWTELPGDLGRGWAKALLDWRKTNRFWRAVFILLWAALLIFATVSAWGAPLLRQGVASIYSAAPSSLLGRLFGSLAQQSGEAPLEAYVNKAVALLPYMSLVGATVLAALIGFAAWMIFPALFSTRRDFSKIFSNCVKGFSNYMASLPRRSMDFLRGMTGEWKASPPVSRGLVLLFGVTAAALLAAYSTLRDAFAWEQSVPVGQTYQGGLSYWIFWAAFAGLGLCFILSVRKVFASLNALYDRRLLLAALFLGLASDIRSLGPFSGALVAMYFLANCGAAAVFPLVEYFLVGGMTAIAFWPNLWIAPLNHFWLALTQAADFNWSNSVLFGGVLYDVKELPLRYIPTVLTLQFTEPALLAFSAGILIAAVYFFRRPSLRADLAVLAAWLVLPILAALLMHSTVYDNARQFLFVLPVVGITGALALESLWNSISRAWVYGLLAVILIVPGVYWIGQLHPYEYVYYNSLAGGLKGAYRNYELDYWGSSYKEIYQALNQAAPQDANVYVYIPFTFVETYVRPDLVTHYRDDLANVDYAVILNKRNKDLALYPDSEVIYRVERGGATLGVLKKIFPGDPTGSYP